MQYQVLARKWRPQTFDELVGQEHVTRTLLNALRSSRVAHAFLFSGPRGSGKTTTARLLAKALNCHAGKPGEPCGQCDACREIAAGNCLDVLEMDAASNRGIDEIRELKEQVRYSPARDKHKIFIIDEVHMLTNEAFNALLKTLEEPPPDVVFIMATTEYYKIPATILSRCQQYAFKLIQFPLILQRLEHIARTEKIQISGTALEQVAFASGGSMRDAMSAFDQVIAFSGSSVRDEDVTMLLGLIEPALLADTTHAIAGNDADKIIRTVAALVESGQDLQNFWRRLLAHFRNLMVLKAGITDTGILGVPDSLVPDLKSQADLFSNEDLLRLYDALFRIEGDLKYASQIRFHVEMGLLELAQLPRLRAIEDLIAEFARVGQGDPPGAGGKAPPPSEAPPPERPPQGSGRGPVRSQPAPAPAVAVPPSESRNQPGRDRADPPPARTTPDAPGLGSRDLLLRLAAAIEKPSLEPVVLALQGAELSGDTVVLDPGGISDFYRRQVRDNLPLIARAAAQVVQRAVHVRIGDDPITPERVPAKSAEPGQEDILDKLKREPVVRSFLDAFPGPVKAEKLD
jgi:DNA polymerase III subunit gamma/tau